MNDVPPSRKAQRKQPARTPDWATDMVEHCHDLLCSHALDGRLLTANPASAKLLGYTVDELVRIPMRELLAPEVRGEFDGYLERIRRDQAAAGLMVVLTRSGERRIWEYHNKLVTKGSAAPLVLGTARDVTDQKRAERELREAEQQFRVSAENLRSKLQAFIEVSLLASPLAAFPEVPLSARETLREREREYIVRVLRETRGIISGPSGAALRLGVKRTTLQSKIKQLGISRAEL
jgi:PAS domain S-box-containing protein